MHLVWFLLPVNPIEESTKTKCRYCKTGTGRGGGPCLECVRQALIGYVGEYVATSYVTQVQLIRLTEMEMYKKSKGLTKKETQ